MPGNLEPLDLGIQIPYHFRCPISLDLMSDPVTISTGQTYDRTSIDSWIAMGNTTCPVTRVALSDFTLIPNHTLRRLIQEWCVANRSNGVERIPTPKQPADPISVRSLLSQASAITGTHVSIRSRAAAIRRLRGLARDSEKNRVLIAGHNAREILVRILFADIETTSLSSELVSESLALLVLLHMTETECEAVASDPSRVGFMTRLLFDSSIEIRVNAAALIEMVLTGAKSMDLKLIISGSDSIFEGVLDLLKNPISSRRALKIGIKAIFALCLVKQTRHLAISAGAPGILIDRLAADFDRCDTERGLATVELLCRLPEGCAAFGEHALTVPLMVKTILRVSDRATEYAAGALLALCTAEERCRDEAAAAGLVTQLLLLVQSDCTERAKRKAQMLLKLLRDSWPDDSTVHSDDFNRSEVAPF
ncbi:putative U box domain, armadillo-like helical, Zinc finger, RING/FYVE/PHD-type [Arabidopsis thaliana]|uniref:U-box domain-containing protein n=3 Tax=Arabidopsis TaxID=3701 RepID=A0A178WCD3_ARATH|nr:U box domain [Arabidopsis thaliana x Arabidopsis arenosa]KAG7656982.1 U box domain [Arabidopsis suecica]OAP14692.1 PUB26 [Arabidopsis thaliana]